MTEKLKLLLSEFSISEIKEIKRMSDIHSFHSEHPEYTRAQLAELFSTPAVIRYWKRYVTPRTVHDIKPFELEDFKEELNETKISK